MRTSTEGTPRTGSAEGGEGLPEEEEDGEGSREEVRALFFREEYSLYLGIEHREG